ncbi:ubiquitin carboxyl-terminal hydrolase 8 [Schistocerca serialis cubense]|uniref:ubiquitin carboxyl-terminal hydrolase 8 n=1 Tax=Schistocerca serialis cubense TaxID=2023355 RepID=UPI00214F338C|nr:ubiquitin carboxyl-terminal hydrolase 8 [Schistocerca serialis cubense]
MPDTSVKQIYLGKCLNDLKPMLDCGKDIMGRNPEILRKSAAKILLEAQQSLRDGDEEKSYVLHMRYIETMMYVLKREEPKSNRKADSLRDALKESVIAAEKLSRSLEKRYKALQDQEKQRIVPKAEEKGSSDELQKEVPKINEPKKKEEPFYNGLPESSITSEKLFELLMDHKLEIVIFDARRTTCFVKSHIKLGNCIANVPEEIINKGQSAATLEKLLPPKSKELWSKRGKVDLIILMDWTSKHSALNEDSKLKILKETLIKWDPDTKYKHEPVILEGGYSDWLDRYPMYTTNSHVVAPVSANSNDLFELLDTIEYPDINDSVTNTAPSLPKVDRSSKPAHVAIAGPTNSNSTASSDADAGGGSVVSDAPSVQHDNVSFTPHNKPAFDRSSKAAALQLYEERSRALARLLEKRETLANNTLNLEKNRLKAEEEWEQIRLRKEKEAEEELRMQLQQKEEELLKNIRNLEKERKEKELENQSLRNELELYKSKEQEELNLAKDKKLTDLEKEVNERINLTEKEMKKITQQREQKEQERKVAEKKQRELKEQEKLRIEQVAKRKEKEHETQEKEKPVPGKGVYYTHLRHDGPSTSSPMKRSHSSPDLAKLDEPDRSAKTPQVDRTSKPGIVSRPNEMFYTPHQKKLYSVYGVVERGLTGLKNLGNTCYMNSILQCLSNTSQLKEFFVQGTYRNYVNKQSDTRGCIVEAVAVVIMSLWSGQYRYFVCDDLKAVVGRFREQFRTSQQQDSNEFLTVLMDWLHEDLKKLKDDSRINESQSVLNEASKHFIEFKRKNKSFIVDLFYGQQKSTVKCLRCDKESVTYETFSNLTLPLPHNNNCSLDDCLKLYLAGERITGWTCPACKEKRDAVKKFDILYLPPVLIIHFKRFYVDGWCRKRQNYVDFPIDKLDMEQYLNESSYNHSHMTFSLYGVSNHYGTMEGGHYTAYCKNDVKNKWYKFDDHEVNVMPPLSVKTGAAYILFYASLQSTVS